MLMQFFKGIPVCRTISVSERYFCITQSQNVMFPIRNNHSNVMILNFHGFISQTRKHNLKLILFESIKEIKIIPFNFACIFLFTDVKYIKFVSWFCLRHFRVYETKIAPIGNSKNRSRDLQRLSWNQNRLMRCNFTTYFIILDNSFWANSLKYLMYLLIV